MDSTMTHDIADTDLSIYGLWPDRRGEAERDGGGGLERKSLVPVTPSEELAGLLNELTDEMRDQFRLFRTLRAEAEVGMARGGEADGVLDGRVDGKVDGKAARADIRGATDAMSLIVRTLEKIDGLQRQLARDRADAEALRAEEDDDTAIRDRLERLIDGKADERARVLFALWRDREEARAPSAGAPPGGDARAGEARGVPVG